MKKLLLLLFTLAAGMANAATLTPGYTFATNETVTAAKLGSLVSAATISGISGSDFADGAVTGAKLGPDSVTTDKILDGTITFSDILSRTLTTTLYGTNSVDGTALATNLQFRAGTMLILTNAGTALNFTNATFGFSASQIPASALSGVITNRSNILSTNFNGYTYSSGAGYTWSTMATLTTTATTGTVEVVGRVLIAPSQAHNVALRVVDSGGTVEGDDGGTPIGGAVCTPYTARLCDTLNGVAKTYTMQVATSSTSTTFTNTIAGGSGTAFSPTNGLGLYIRQAP